MYNQFIKEWLLSNQSRVYSVIVSTYYQKLADLKPTLFRKWLSKEIDIPEDKINLSSLNSALARYKKNEAKGKRIQINNTSISNSKDNLNPNFKFSSVEEEIPKSRTTEI